MHIIIINKYNKSKVCHLGDFFKIFLGEIRGLIPTLISSSLGKVSKKITLLQFEINSNKMCKLGTISKSPVHSV